MPKDFNLFEFLIFLSIKVAIIVFFMGLGWFAFREGCTVLKTKEFDDPDSGMHRGFSAVWRGIFLLGTGVVLFAVCYQLACEFMK